jgi:hypothetical protein
MAREIPELVRAAAGLAATVLDEARKLPETLPGLPVRLIGLALQRAMRIQQHYAGLVARGDELFTGIRGEDEPGLATFDDDDEPAPAASSGGFRESAFDRVDDLPLDDGTSEEELIETQLLDAEFADDPAVEAIVDEVEFAAVVAEDARETVEVLAGEAPSTDALLEEVLDDIAIEDLVADVPETAIPVEAALPDTPPLAKKTAPGKAAASKAPAKKTAKKAAKKAAAALPETSDPGPAPLTPRGTAALAVPPAATPPAAAAAEPSPPHTTTSLAAPATAPIEGYDFLSLAQLRGHLRGYAAPTVEQLLAYEKDGLAREPYLRMLRNRLERLRSESA